MTKNPGETYGTILQGSHELVEIVAVDATTYICDLAVCTVLTGEHAGDRVSRLAGQLYDQALYPVRGA